MLLLTLGCHRQALPDCGPKVQGLTELVRPGAFLVFGEVHGTVESPAFVGRAACEMAAKGLPVTLGLEIPAEEQGRIDTYLGSDGGPADRAELLAGPFWSRDFQDGRSSQAILALIETARTLRAPVLAYEGAEYGDPALRDAHMARRLLDARAADPERALVVLTGNLHARRMAGLPPLRDKVPMASLVAVEAPDLITLDAWIGGGEYWACTGADVADCGVHRWRDRPDTGPKRVDRTVARDGFDGVYAVGRITAARPAVEGTKPTAAE